MICKHCNSNIPDDSVFCPSCGKKAEAQKNDPNLNICPNCGTELPKGSNFCTTCGTSIGVAQTPTCVACGAELAPGATFCTSCGAKVGAPVKAPKPPKAPGEPAPLVIPKKMLALIGAGIAGVALFIGLIMLIISLFGSSKEDVIENYFEANCYADVDAAMDCYHDEMLDYLMEMSDGEENFMEEAEDELKATLKAAEKKYGDFEDYEFEIVDEEEYDVDDLSGIILKMIDMDIEEAVQVEVEYTIYFEDDEIEDTTTMVLICVDGDWYLFKANELF